VFREYRTDGAVLQDAALQLDKYSHEMLAFFAGAPLSRLPRSHDVMNKPVYRYYLGRLRAGGRYYLEPWRVKMDEIS
jgi:hypothetical protein